MSVTTYGPGAIDHNGSVLVMVANDGTCTVIAIPGDSTITVQTLRTAGDPVTLASGVSKASAETSVDAQLTQDSAV